MSKTIYIFSGMGADERVFERLDFAGRPLVFIQWVRPHSTDTLTTYSGRLMEQILEQKPILVGLSLGGMLAVEVAKQIETERIILLASAKTRKGIPPLYKLLGKFGFDRILPFSLFKRADALLSWLFGAQSQYEKELLHRIMLDTDPDFVTWAIRAVLHWDNLEIPKNLTHLHGTKDLVLPLRYADCDITISGGGHFMTMNKADEINQILPKLLG